MRFMSVRLHLQMSDFLCRNPLEVSEDFVQQYNNAKDLDEKEKYEQTAHKMLERSKVHFCSKRYIHVDTEL